MKPRQCCREVTGRVVDRMQRADSLPAVELSTLPEPSASRLGTDDSEAGLLGQDHQPNGHLVLDMPGALSPPPPQREHRSHLHVVLDSAGQGHDHPSPGCSILIQVVSDFSGAQKELHLLGLCRSQAYSAQKKSVCRDPVKPCRGFSGAGRAQERQRPPSAGGDQAAGQDQGAPGRGAPGQGHAGHREEGRQRPRGARLLVLGCRVQGLLLQVKDNHSLACKWVLKYCLEQWGQQGPRGGGGGAALIEVHASAERKLG